MIIYDEWKFCLAQLGNALLCILYFPFPIFPAFLGENLDWDFLSSFCHWKLVQLFDHHFAVDSRWFHQPVIRHYLAVLQSPADRQIRAKIVITETLYPGCGLPEHYPRFATLAHCNLREDFLCKVLLRLAQLPRKYTHTRKQWNLRLSLLLVMLSDRNCSGDFRRVPSRQSESSDFPSRKVERY